MNTLKMIAEIKQSCEALEAEKAELVARVKQIDDTLSGWRMAQESLEMTIPKKSAAQKVEPQKSAQPAGEFRNPTAKFGRKTVMELNGKRQTLTEWAEECGVSFDAVYYRLNHGWSLQDALSKGRQNGKCGRAKQNRARKVFAYDAHHNVIRQWTTLGTAAVDLKMPESTVKSILQNISPADQLLSRDYYIAYAK